MRYVKYLFLAVIAVCLITLALANREVVTLRLVPEELASFLPWSWSLRMPLFLVVFGGIVAGLLIGFVWEWLREWGQRRQLSRLERELKRLERELKLAKARAGEADDDVLALVE